MRHREREWVPSPDGTVRSRRDRGTCESFGIYIHIPFCVRKCPYCDFVSGPAGEEDRASYVDAMKAEIRASQRCAAPGSVAPGSAGVSPALGPQASRLPLPVTARTIYFGGGTPSELAPSMLAEIMATVRDCFPLAPDAECSIECNPGTLSESKLAGMRSMGFNRVSLGVQSFSDRFLAQLGRIHTSAEAREAYALMRSAGFDNINLDLIFGIPGQTLEDWREDLREALELRPEHLSLYGLTIEPETEFGRLKAVGLVREIDEEVSASMYEIAVELTAAAGYEQYEISNFARPGKECRHNLIYWHNEEYLGFGVSAASYVGGVRWSNVKERDGYVQAAADGCLAPGYTEKLDARAALGEEIMLRLRLAEGFSFSELQFKYGLDPEVVYFETLGLFLSEGLLARENGSIRLTPRGRLLANEVCRRFL